MRSKVIWPHGKDGCRQTSKASGRERGGKTSRMQEKGKRTAKMEGLRVVGYEKIGGG